MGEGGRGGGGGGEDERGQEEVRENWEMGRYSVGSVNTLHAVCRLSGAQKSPPSAMCHLSGVARTIIIVINNF